jgi:hypothetical protein
VPVRQRGFLGAFNPAMAMQQCTRLLWIGRERTVASFEQFFILIGEGVTLLSVVLMPLSGAVSDRVGRRALLDGASTM